MVSVLQHRFARGFTLTEMLTVLAILGILGAMAAPAYTGWIGSVRASSAATDLQTALQHARSEAIKRNAEVTLAPTGDGWQSGWRIAAPSDADVLLLDHPALQQVEVEGPDSVTYLPNGRVRATDLPQFAVSAATGDLQRCVVVDLSGRPRQNKSTC